MLVVRSVLCYMYCYYLGLLLLVLMIGALGTVVRHSPRHSRHAVTPLSPL